ncbi:MAG: hypothetical protein AAB370_05430 [Verrucomicrobiota bacterium]
MEPKHSGWGITSFSISLLVGFLIFVTLIVAGVMQARTPEGMDENSPVTIFIGLAIIGLLLLDLLAIGFGVVGLLQRNTKKVFAILGIVFAALTLLGTIALIIFGNARMAQ